MMSLILNFKFYVACFGFPWISDDKKVEELKAFYQSCEDIKKNPIRKKFGLTW